MLARSPEAHIDLTCHPSCHVLPYKHTLARAELRAELNHEKPFLFTVKLPGSLSAPLPSLGEVQN